MKTDAEIKIEGTKMLIKALRKNVCVRHFILFGILLLFSTAFLLRISCAAEKFPPLIPYPQVMEIHNEGAFVVNKGTGICVNDGENSGYRVGVNMLVEDIKKYMGKTPQVSFVTNPDKLRDNIIFIGNMENHNSLKRVNFPKFFEDNSQLHPEGYKLYVGPKKVIILGKDEAGTFYGIQTLRQLIKKRGTEVSIPGIKISDYPQIKMRGVHLCFQQLGAVDLSFVKMLIREVLAAHKINTLIIQVDDGMKYERHPQLSKNWAIDKIEMKEIISYAQKHFIQVIPEIQSLGHQDYFFLPAYPELAENPNNPWDYCPSNPKVYQILFDVLDEVIALFQPDYLHIGHDEVEQLGVCPKCRQKEPHLLFSSDVNKINTYISQKGVKTMMWGDMAVHKWDKKALQFINKDIIICYWDYRSREDYPELDYLKEKGFTIIGTPWYAPLNIRNMARAIFKRKGLGLIGSTWHLLQPNFQNQQAENTYCSLLLVAHYSWRPESQESLDEIKDCAYGKFKTIMKSHVNKK